MYKKTIVQIESFYPQLLQEAYGAFPGLRGLPFERQIAHLLATGFSGGHNVVPFLNPSQWDGHYIVLNCPWSQQRWAEEHGLPVGIGGRDLLLAQLRHLQPDVLYLSDIPGFDFTLLDELPSRPAVVGWHATTVSAQTPWSAFDLVLSGIQGIRDEVLARGARAAADFMCNWADLHPGSPVWCFRARSMAASTRNAPGSSDCCRARWAMRAWTSTRRNPLPSTWKTAFVFTLRCTATT